MQDQKNLGCFTKEIYKVGLRLRFEMRSVSSALFEV